MARLLIEARDAARAARADGKRVLDQDVLDSVTGRYRAIARDGLARNVYRRTATADDAPDRPPLHGARGHDPPLRHPP